MHTYKQNQYSSPQNQGSSSALSFFEKLKQKAKGFAVRLLVHASALASAFIIGEQSPYHTLLSPQGMNYGLVVLSSYIGLVCLFSRGMALRSRWLVPFGAGLVQCAVLIGAGLPLHFSIFFAGVQTWLLRILQKKGKNNTEWVALFFIVLAGCAIIMHYSLPFALLTFPLISIIAATLGKMLKFRNFLPVYQLRLQKQILQLEQSLASRKLPPPLENITRELDVLTRQLNLQFPSPSDNALQLFDAIELASNQVHKIEARQQPGVWDYQTDVARANIAAANKLITQYLGTLPQSSPNQSPGLTSGNNNLTRFELSAGELWQKKNQLPEQLHPHIQGIYTSTLEMVNYLQSSPKGMRPASNFLDRYLKATHRVLDEFIRLNAKTGQAPNQMMQQNNAALNQALTRSEHLLSRLESAFASELAHLQQNDMISLSAELGVLDSLLKMDGR